MQKNSLENLDDENIPLTKSKKSEKPNLKKLDLKNRLKHLIEPWKLENRRLNNVNKKSY